MIISCVDLVSELRDGKKYSVAAISTFYVSQFKPSPVGHGGNHRAYQVVHDLEQIMGPGELYVLSYGDILRKYPPPVRPVKQSSWFRKSARKFTPLRRAVISLRSARAKAQEWRKRWDSTNRGEFSDLLVGEESILQHYSSQLFVNHYSKLVRESKTPHICIIEHISFTNLLPLNKKLGIPTLICPQNLEVFDASAPINLDSPAVDYGLAVDFANELAALAFCEERLFISQVETAVFNGLGIPSKYYPYIPVGEIQKRSLDVRKLRIRDQIDRNTFLMLGSGEHSTTWHAFTWFIKEAHEKGLPPGIKVIVAGSRTNELLEPGVDVTGLEVKGWLPQDELDSLLHRVRAVLIPQLTGFGALTRLPELSLAGIPMIVSEHPTRALDPPPGIITVPDEWSAWYAAMEQMMAQPLEIDLAEYLDWEEKQVNPLRSTISSLMDLAVDLQRRGK